ELVPMGTRAIANLDVSVAAFRSTIDQEFTEAAKLHHHSSKQLAATVRQVGESSDALKSGSEDLRHAVEQQLEDLAQRIAQGSRGLNAMLAECSRAAEQAVAAQRAIAEAARE